MEIIGTDENVTILDGIVYIKPKHTIPSLFDELKDWKRWLLLLVILLTIFALFFIADAVALFLCSWIVFFLLELVCFIINRKHKLEIPLPDIYEVCRNEQMVIIKYHAKGCDMTQEISITDERKAEEMVNALQCKL